MEYRLKKFLKQTGVAMTEYAVLLAFVAAVGASFTSDSGLSSSISGAVSKVVSVFGYFGGYKEVAAGNQPNFSGTGSGVLSGIEFGSHESGKWSWKNVYTNDSGQEAGSAFLENGNKESQLASEYAKELLDQMYAAGSFGGVDPMSWAFTEGCGTNTQSLNLYWSNSDWKSIRDGSVPIIQMNKEAGSDKTQYYVAMANVEGGKLQLWNQAAALKGDVSYVDATTGGMVNMTCDATGTPTDGKHVNTASQNLSPTLAFTDFNAAQKAYYDLVNKNNIQTQNNYKP